MMRFGKCLISALAVTAISTGFSTAAEPDFKEVYDLLRTNSIVSDSELNQAAVTGLLNELGPRATLLTNTNSAFSISTTQLVSKVFVFENEIAYLRISSITDDLADELRAAYKQLDSTNKLKGLVLDLRFTGGDDYSAAVKMAELFPIKKTATLDWNGQSREFSGHNPLSPPPLLVLINSETARAAEALAAMLRESEACLLLGNSTAGHALTTKDFKLSTGATLRIATAPVKLNGTNLSKITPDIKVAISPQEERKIYDTEFLTLPKITDAAMLATNRPVATNFALRRPRNEAELVRAHRQGLNLDELPDVPDLPRINTPPVPAVADPVLSRAVDLLKGLAIVQQARP